ncbi:MAG: hypothetical protein VX498_15290, partial [Myxococcota bacterium]|nr:hypothetical protein [Myxococcota bacterium]
CFGGQVVSCTGGWVDSSFFPPSEWFGPVPSCGVTESWSEDCDCLVPSEPDIFFTNVFFQTQECR